MIYSAPFACRHYISSRINSGFLLWQIIDGRMNCDGSRFSVSIFAPHENSLVGYDSLMKIFQFWIMKKFFPRLVSLAFGFMIIFGVKKLFRFNPHGVRSFTLSEFPIQQRSIILLETFFSLCILRFILWDEEWKLEKLCRLHL